MIIDFHTHIFPDKIAKRAVKTLENNILEVQGKAHYAKIPATLDFLKRSMAENGVDASVVLPIATTVTQYASINNFAAQINNNGGIYSFGSLHPIQENVEETLLDIKEKGLRGIKLHPEYQNFYIDSPESLTILRKCSELDLIVVVHAGRDIGAKPPVHCPPEKLRRVIDLIPDLKIVTAHMGGWKMWDDVEKYLCGTPVFFDTAFSLSDIESGQALRIIKAHGSKKILFATDSPWESPSFTIRSLRSLGLTEDELDDIFYKNAKKLLKI